MLPTMAEQDRYGGKMVIGNDDQDRPACPDVSPAALALARIALSFPASESAASCERRAWPFADVNVVLSQRDEWRTLIWRAPACEDPLGSALGSPSLPEEQHGAAPVPPRTSPAAVEEESSHVQSRIVSRRQASLPAPPALPAQPMQPAQFTQATPTVRPTAGPTAAPVPTAAPTANPTAPTAASTRAAPTTAPSILLQQQDIEAAALSDDTPASFLSLPGAPLHQAAALSIGTDLKARPILSRPSRLGPAALHLIQGLILIPLLILLSPIGLPILAVLVMPQIFVSLFSSGDERGLSKSWKRWHALPRAIPLFLFIHLPMALLYVVYLVAGVAFLSPIALVAIELYVALSNAVKGRGRSRAVVSPGNIPATKANIPTRPAHKAGADADARYRTFDAVWEALEGNAAGTIREGDVRLVSLCWLVSLGTPGTKINREYGGVLRRRQELPPEAFIDAKQLREIESNTRLSFDVEGVWSAISDGGSVFSVLIALLKAAFVRKRNRDGLLPIVAVSYAWLEPKHPDPKGEQLQLLCSRLSKLYGGRGLLGAARAYGFSDMGVFLDWASLYQKDPDLFDERETPEGQPEMERAEWLEDLAQGRNFFGGKAYEESRSAEQKSAFGRALHKTMDLWYGHTATTVLLLTALPAGFDTSIRTYESRGWTTFERCSAELGKSFHLSVAKWKLVIDNAGHDGVVDRRLPTTPERMQRLLEQKHFTNGADTEVVLDLYTRTATAMLGSIESLSYAGLELERGSEWRSPAQLREALGYCACLRRLHLRAMRLGDDDLRELSGIEGGAMPVLEELDISHNPFNVGGVAALCSMLMGGAAPKLRLLKFIGCDIDDEGALQLGAALASGSMPEQLRIFMPANCIGSIGAGAIAQALLQSSFRGELIVNSNRIGLFAQSFLLYALEAKHGYGLVRSLAITLNNPPIFPLQVKLCGTRRSREEGLEMNPYL